MAFIGRFIEGAVKVNNRLLNREERKVSQQNTLRKLLKKAESTAFGKEYGFKHLLKSPDLVQGFQELIPIYDYNSFYEEWLHRVVEHDEKNIAWPGKIKYFALSSGTSGAPSKKIPVSIEMLVAMHKASFRHFCSLQNLNIPRAIYDKQILHMGGSTQLSQVENHYEGDLSGILRDRLPFWLDFFSLPRKAIAKQKEWTNKLHQMTLEAEKWDIGVITGVPSWVQLLMENIIKHYQVETIHDIWPNLQIYVHGGVSFAPYKQSFKKLLGKDLIYLETYLASEGFLAFQETNEEDGMLPLLDNGIFFEFIPFDEDHFDSEGNVLPNVQPLSYEQIKTGVQYAVLITTCAGLWRYMIGDTVVFDKGRMKITGRIKHFLSICGEHLSVDNMNQGIQKVSQELGLEIKEFTVAGLRHDSYAEHQWFIGTDKSVDREVLKEKLDQALKNCNDDYGTERKAGVLQMTVQILPNEVFYDFMESQGKMGGQSKFPRVIGKKLDDWKEFLSSQS